MLAASPSWSAAGMSPDPLVCGKADTTVALQRAEDGSYSGTVTAKYGGKVDPKTCPKSMTISLTPTT